MIRQDIEQNVWALLASTAERHDMHIVKAEGIENHVHVLIEIPKTVAVSEAMKRLKAGSSNAINKANIVPGHFAWQDGYGTFTVSASAVPDVVEYIAKQREHHQSRTFEEEFVKFLKKHDVEYDSKYLWA